MDQETILRRLVTPVQNDGDGPFSHAILPGLFRAAIVKPRNNKNSQKNSCHRKRDCGNDCKNDVKRLGRSKVLGSSNFSIADLILIGNGSGETLSSNPSCPAYRFCVGRAATAAAATSVTGVPVDHEDSVISSELPTLRELLEPIKQTAMRMKRLSQIKDECCEPENNIDIEESSRCQVCGMKTQNIPNSNNHAIEQQFDMFGEGDKLMGLDGNVLVKIISGMEGGQFSGDPLMKIIEQLISQMPNMQLEHSERREIPITEYIEVQDIGIQSPGWLNENIEFCDEDAASVQSYEFIKTMDIGCGSEPETRNNNVCCNGGNDRFNGCQNDHNENVDPILLNILAILKDIQQAELKKSNAKQTHITEPMCCMDSKSRALKDSVTKTIPRRDKSVDCTCGSKLDPGSKSTNKVEVTNAVSFKSSYVLENLETVSVSPENQTNPRNCCSKDVSTSAYTMSVFKQITSMSQSKITTSRKRSSSSQCDIGPQSISKLFCNNKNQRKRETKPQKITKTASFKEPVTIPETTEESCPCGCGFFLEGDDTCSCGCDESADASHQAVNVFESKYTVDSMKNSTIARGSCQDRKHTKNCYDCGCDDDSQTREVPLDPIVKLMNCRYAEQDETIINSIQLETDQVKENEGMDLEAEARKLQQKIQCYRKENEYFRKLIQQACTGCQENYQDALSRTPPIRATYSGLATAIEILQAKCRSKDGMIAILAEGLRGVVNYAQIAKNLAAPCLEYTYWDFDQSTLYTYLRGTISKLSVEAKKNAGVSRKETKCISEPSKKKFVPPPTDFKVEELCKCLFASWKIPENISNVAGYRIYVNGNVATNVRSATRTETILGFMDTLRPTELVLHSFDKEDILSDPVTITYPPNNIP